MGKSQPNYTKEFKQQALQLFAHKWENQSTDSKGSWYF